MYCKVYVQGVCARCMCKVYVLIGKAAATGCQAGMYVLQTALQVAER